MPFMMVGWDCSGSVWPSCTARFIAKPLMADCYGLPEILPKIEIFQAAENRS